MRICASNDIRKKQFRKENNSVWRIYSLRMLLTSIHRNMKLHPLTHWTWSSNNKTKIMSTFLIKIIWICIQSILNTFPDLVWGNSGTILSDQSQIVPISINLKLCGNIRTFGREFVLMLYHYIKCGNMFQIQGIYHGIQIIDYCHLPSLQILILQFVF